MDPVTAINNRIAALFQFLAVNSKIGTQLGDLIGHIHATPQGQLIVADIRDQLPPAPPKVA